VARLAQRATATESSSIAVHCSPKICSSVGVIGVS